MRTFFYSLLGLLFLVLGFALYSVYCYKTPHSYAPQTIVIPPHSGARAVLGQLHEAGLVPSLPVMVLPLLFSGHKGQLKAGEYEFSAGDSPAKIIKKIAHGEIVVHKLLLPEGWNRFQLRAILLNEPLLTGPLPEVIPEGSVFPDTMNFTRGEARSAVLARMQKARDANLIALWNGRDPNLPLATPEQALILASIVEKETGVPSERALVAGVFINRLRLGMPLQTDPTVAYGIINAQNGAPMNHALTLVDLKTDTPYNTYTRPGLPPTPICNPGREALNAALHPAQTNALYFVATGHGGHNFAATVEEHTKNVAAYHAALQAAGH